MGLRLAASLERYRARPTMPHAPIANAGRPSLPTRVITYVMLPVGALSLIQCKISSVSNDNLSLKIIPERVYQNLPATQLAEVLQSPENRHETRDLQFNRGSVRKG